MPTMRTASLLSSATSNSTDPKRAGKPSARSRVVVLSLRSELLAQFPSAEPSPGSTSRSKSSPSSTSTPALSNAQPSPGEASSEANVTPVPGVPNDDAPPAAAEDAAKRKSLPGPKPGAKRSFTTASDGLVKPKGKPGPKKKLKTEDANNEQSDLAAASKSAPTTAATTTASKLGPKASLGAINAGLRALDRSGRPCKKWERKGLKIKSFTGVTWDLSTWRAPKLKTLDVTPDQEGPGPNKADSKGKVGDSAAESEKSNGDVDAAASTSILASSPAPIVAASA
ncbi:MAG: hypothetical protein M1817_000208 [Caeruleum heppii]|nr:MAG: hypothetical protein M1817_000208 [Caeruleum heppii]